MNTTTRATDDMVSRFLGWRLPQHFYPDCHISFDREKASQSPHSWPTGTNLLDAGQARAMLEHVLGADASRAGTLLDAMKSVTLAMQSDLDYAWSWHCNIAMAAFDAGCPHDVANEGAARFMQLLANVDTRKHSGFAQTQVKAAPDARPKPAPEPATTGETEQDKQTAHLFETKTYPDGTTATGLGPLPDASPADPIEAEIQAKGLTAPRVTQADVDGSIEGCYYFTAHQGVVGQALAGSGLGDIHHGLRHVTICTLILRNGHKIVGVNTGSVSPTNFDAELARKLAHKHAVDQVWPLLGYALRERLASA